MKKIVLPILLLVGCIGIGRAQTPGWLWAHGGGGGNFQWGCGTGVDDSSNMYISGRFSGTMTFGTQSLTNSQNADGVFFGKFDKNGTCLWLQQHPYSSGDYDYALGFSLDDSANLYGTGLVGSGFGMYNAKYNRGGKFDYSNTNGTGGGSYGSSPNGAAVAADHNGYAYATGSLGGGSYTFGSSTLTYAGTGTSQMMFLTKLGHAGNYLWAVSASGAGAAAGNDGGRGIVIDHTNQYIYVSGTYTGSPTFGGLPPEPASTGYANLFLAKYDSSGNVIWVATASSAGAEFGSNYQTIQMDNNNVALDSCGNAFVTGFFQGTSQFGNISITAATGAGGYDAFVAKCNNSGQWEWVKDISSGHSTWDFGRGVAINNNGDVFALGRFDSTANFGSGITEKAAGASDLYVAKYSNSDGSLQWVQDASIGDFNSVPYGIALDKQSFAYITGSIWNTITPAFGAIVVPSTGLGNVFVAKLDTVTPRTIIPALSLNYCPGSTETISYTVTGVFNNGNVFTAQLSDSTGNFANAVAIGNTSSNLSGTIQITIPSNTPQGKHYLIRIVSSSPAGSSNANGCGYYNSNNFYITIGSSLNLVLTPNSSNDTICSGVSITLKVTGGGTYAWNNNATADSIIVHPTADTTYSVHVVNGGCSADTAFHIAVNPAGTFDVLPLSPTICNGSSVTLYVSVAGSNFTWSPSTGLSVTTGDTVIASPTINVIYTVTGNALGGCLANGTDDVSVVPAPNKPVISRVGDVLTSSATQGNQWFVNDTSISGATNQSYTITATGCYSVNTINPANGCSATSDTTCAVPTGINQLSVIGNQLSIFPNPTTGSIFIIVNSSVQNVKDWNLEVTDVLGRRLYSKASLNYGNEIDLSNFSGGVYFITVKNKTDRVVYPIVKQN